MPVGVVASIESNKIYVSAKTEDGCTSTFGAVPLGVEMVMDKTIPSAYEVGPKNTEEFNLEDAAKIVPVVTIHV